MAEENDTTANADAIANAVPNADAPAAVEAEPAPKKQRKPRMKKAFSDVAGADTAVGLAGGNGQKRGRKPKALAGASAAKGEPVKRALKDEQTAAVEASPGDEIADLLQLEEENQKLRKLLAEKLRVENADLRKKLKLG